MTSNLKISHGKMTDFVSLYLQYGEISTLKVIEIL